MILRHVRQGVDEITTDLLSTILRALPIGLGAALSVTVLSLAGASDLALQDTFAALRASELFGEVRVDQADDIDTLLAGAERLREFPGVSAVGISSAIGSRSVATGALSATPIEVEIVAATSGFLEASGEAVLEPGRLLDEAFVDHSPQVVVLGYELAERLRIPSVTMRPAVLLDGVPYTVIGILENSGRSSLADRAIVPFGNLEVGASLQELTLDVRVSTDRGQAAAMLRRAPSLLLPTNPSGAVLSVPPEATILRARVFGVSTQLIALTAGAVLVGGTLGGAQSAAASFERRKVEFAIRSSLGATRRALLTQVVTESVATGLLGGCSGAGFAAWAALFFSWLVGWRPDLDPLATLLLIGLAVAGSLVSAFVVIRKVSRIDVSQVLRS